MNYIYAIAVLIITSIYFYCWCYPYKIISHCDGDTSWIKPIIGKKKKVRYAVIDANESRQAGGKEAKEYLTRILPIGSRVSIVPTSNKKSYDREIIATIYKGWTDINLKMLIAGYAIIDPDYLHEISPKMQKQYVRAEKAAIKHRLGRWGDPAHYQLSPKQGLKK